MGFTVDSGVNKIEQIVETVSTFISIMTLLHNLSVMNRFVWLMYEACFSNKPNAW